MKKIRGFRLGKRLVRVWRWVRRRPWHRAHLRLPPGEPPSPSQSPCLYRQYSHKGATAVTARIAGWGRFLTHGLGGSSRVWLRRGGLAGGQQKYRGRPHEEGDEYGLSDHLLSHEEDEKGLYVPHRKPQQQQQQQRLRVETEAWWKPPPKGHLAVYVGRKEVERPHRVLVPVVYFNHPLFGELLRGAEEEFGFHHPGGITIPCPISDFESVRTRVAAASGLGSRHSVAVAGLRR